MQNGMYDIVNSLSYALFVMKARGGGIIDFANTSGKELLEREPELEEFLIRLLNNISNQNSGISEYDIHLPSGIIADIHISQEEGASAKNIISVIEKNMAEKARQHENNKKSFESISVISAALAHEIKNPLAGIKGAAQIWERHADEHDKQLPKLICDEADRITSLVDDIHELAMFEEAEKTAVNIHEVLTEVKLLGKHSFAENIKLIEEYDPSLPEVKANKSQLKQIFINLIKNACEAAEKEVKIKTSFLHDIRISSLSASEGENLSVMVSVINDGIGIPENIKDKIFQPFISTKSNGRGLGLPLVAKLVNNNNGIVEFENIDNNTIFKILLPLYK